MIVLLKSGKSHPKNFKLILLLCHLSKLYEKLILNRIAPTIKENLIKNQAEFQLNIKFNLTQHIEDDFKTKQITGAVFVDLIVA